MEPPRKQSKLSPVLEWQMWFVDNYEFKQNAETDVTAIIEHASNVKENFRSDLNSITIGKIIKSTYGDRVSVSQRGKRGNRFRVYKNLKVKDMDRESSSTQSTASDFITELSNMPLESNWNLVRDNSDSASLIYHTKHEYNGHRITYELRLKKSKETGEISYEVKSGGRSLLMDQGFSPLLSNKSNVESVKCLMDFIQTAKPCEGVVEMDLISPSSIPHVKGEFKDLSVATGKVQTRVFAKDCLIFCPSSHNTKFCKNCYNLSRQQEKKEKRDLTPKPETNNKYLSNHQLIEKLKKEKKKRKSTEVRENYWREKYEMQLIEMDEKDNTDLEDIFNSIGGDHVPPDMKYLWEQQLKNNKCSSSKSYRWHPKIIRLCLDLYCKNPHVLDSLREFITLPSQRTIRLHKSKVEQKPGWNGQVLAWCLQEARKQNLKDSDYMGGFVIDEMKIQENLEMAFEKGKHKLVGFVSLGENHNSMSNLSGNQDPQCELAQQVLQFIFLSDKGFRFPIAQFPSGNCTPSDLYFIFWEGVRHMFDYGFRIYWCILDGAETNRQFIKLHFNDNPADHDFVTHNIVTGEPLVFIVDCKHNIKKIRNNISKSNKDSKPRCLTLQGKTILWSQLYAAFTWDQDNHSLPVHERLTLQHFQLDPASKMRNALAEDVLDSKMLYLLQAFQKSQNDKGEELDSTIKLLKITAQIIAIFSSFHHIADIKDPRLIQLMAIYDFFKNWKEEIKNTKQYISDKLWFDLQSMILGFIAIVKIKLKKYPDAVIKPAIVNQDCVENHFCQIRACNGQNNNPTYKLQQSCQNSIILGQTTISRKSNAGKQMPKCKTSLMH